MRLRFSHLAAATALTTSLLAVSSAHAGGFALREQSAWGQGASFAGVAAGGTLSTMFWNPATLGQVESIATENVQTLLFADSDMDLSIIDNATGGTLATENAGNIGGWAYIPAGYSAMRLTDQLVLGVGINGPYGLATKYETNPASIARVQDVGGTSEAFSINVNPNLAYQINDQLTIAAGVQIQYLQVRYTDFVTPTGVGPLGDAALDGDGINFGFTAGIHYTSADERTSIGLGYRSRITNDLEGDLTGVGLAPPPGGGPVASNVDAVVRTPDVVTFGLSHRINDMWTVLAGVEWTNWSILDEAPVDVDANPALDFAIPFEYEDGWYFSLGAEYDLNEHVTLRGGVGYELSPISDDHRTLRLPDDERLWLSVGGSYELNDRFSFDVGYSYVHVFDGDVDNATNANAGRLLGGNARMTADVDASVHIISTAFKMKLGHGPLFGGSD